jgi:signal transduction histidine kinase
VSEQRASAFGAAAATGASVGAVADECRRLGELLDLDVVGIQASFGDGPRAASWSAPGSADMPGDLEALVAGVAPGWIGERLDDGSIVYAHLTPRSSPRASTVLRAVGPSLTQALAEADVTAGAEDEDEAPMTPVRRVIAAARAVLENPDASIADLLFALRESLDADEVFLLVERGADVEVTSSPASERLRRIPQEIRAKVGSLGAGRSFEEATSRQLAVVLGAKTPFVSAAFSRQEEPAEVLLLGWREDAGVSSVAMKLIAAVTGAARAALDTRRRAVDGLLMRERTRWAYEIHDGVTQAVTTSVLELEALTHKIERDPKEAIETLAVSKTEIRKALSELRGILFELSRDKTSDPVEEEPLVKYVQDVVRRWRLPARVTVRGDLHHVPKPLLGAGYVVIREALANAAKHADARNVTVWVSAEERELVVEVADTGRGFNTGRPRTDREERHFGLEMMGRRVAEVGGSLNVDSAPSRGTRITARLPIEQGTGDG